MAYQKNYSVILMDIQMPILSGYEATKRIRRIKNPNQNTTIIALTASTLLSNKQKALDLGMNDYLAKPFTPIQLSALLKKHFKGQQIKKYKSNKEKVNNF